MTDLDCKDLKALLSGLIDGELDEPMRHRAERHLADCPSCRALVNEAESLNHLLAMDAAGALPMTALPASFENAVLRQTIYAEAYDFAGRRWTSWLGWVAAAACLGLASSLWFINHQMIPAGSNAIAMGTENLPMVAPRASVYAATGLKSWTHDGGLPPDALAGVGPANDDIYRAVDEQLSYVIPISYQTPAILSLSPEPISAEDADALFAASNLLDMFSRANLTTFADVERIRQIAEYDELLDRLTAARGRLGAADRAVIMAAESVLLRIVNGPLSLEDLVALQEASKSLELPRQIEAITNQADTVGSSL